MKDNRILGIYYADLSWHQDVVRAASKMYVLHIKTYN